MAKYRMNPVEVEAFQYDGDFKDQTGVYYVPRWAVAALEDGRLYFKNAGKLYVKTIVGDRLVSVGDYIIQYSNGEMCQGTATVFELTYEPVEEEIVGGFRREDGSGEVWKRHVE